MYDLLDMKLMQYASEELNLGAVAARASLSLSAVSIRLTKLEVSIGVQLLYRSGTLRLTAAGKRFLVTAITILDEAEKLSTDLDAIRFGKTANIKIMCNASLAIDDLPYVIDRLDIEFPTLYVDQVEGSFPEIRNAVMNGSADIGLLASDTPIPGLNFIKYKTEKLVLLVPMDHPLAQSDEKAIPFQHSLAYDFIGTDHSKYIRNLADRIATEHDTHIHYRATVSNFEAQCTMVGQTDMGIALVMETIAKRYTSTMQVKQIALTDDWASGHLMACVRDLDTAPIVVKRFVELMQMRFKPMD
jgi:DNA-binding transcriptional LysR family regulator